MRFENTAVYNIYNAILGARNPMNSWDKSDSVFKGYNGKIENTSIGKNDLELMQKLIKAGSEHRKFLRQIFVSVDITAPAYFMAELDTYKIGITRNSSSFMHKGTSRPFELSDFEIDDSNDNWNCVSWKNIIQTLNLVREKYLETKDNKYFRLLRQLLPNGYLYHSTITMNYENILNMIHQRKNHRLVEWSDKFINWAKSLPYANELLFWDK